MLKRFDVKALCTTDDPAVPIFHHEAIGNNPEIETGVYPTFRPDKAWGIGLAEPFKGWLEGLEEALRDLHFQLGRFSGPLTKRIEDFHAIGSRISDHSFPYFFCDFPNDEDAKRIFQDTLQGQNADRAEEEAFGAFVMLHLARLYAKKGWTMQIHLGPLRNNSSRLIQSFGPDAGTDSIGDWPQAERMGHFLDRLDSENALPKTIVYNNNPSDNFTVATMLGNFQREVPARCSSGQAGGTSIARRDGGTTQDLGQPRPAFAIRGHAHRFAFLPFLPPPRIFPENSVQPAWNLDEGWVRSERAGNDRRSGQADLLLKRPRIPEFGRVTDPQRVGTRISTMPEDPLRE